MIRHMLIAFFGLTVCASLSHAQKEHGFDNRKSSGQPYLKPAESVARMKVPEGFEVKLFAGEPDVVNPIAMTVDEKGRVWIVECFEYPKRTAKDKMPRDRIVILEDTDGDGVCDKRTVFAEGKDFPVPFDLASGIEVGNGGVYVGAPPYLFFIENKKDKPGKFEILLKGFGSQDTHEMLNTFQWGPDGWLYGLHGVFTQSDVKPAQADGPATRLNAGIWRYHPTTKKFEIFAEGTSNPWGMDWRNTDGQFILCCCVIPHLYHIVPGGNYKRQAGQSYNPYAYGDISEICDHTFHKESGWAHAGLISLDTPLMPEQYRNSVIFGSIHGCSLKQNILKKNGSSYIASRGDDFLVSGDKNFRPINLRWGPNGEIYCIDWHDQNPCHQAAADAWDYERGRVFRIQTKGLKTKKPEDLSVLSQVLLVEKTRSPNPYVSRTALRLLRERTETKAKEQMMLRPSDWQTRMQFFLVEDALGMNPRHGNDIGALILNDSILKQDPIAQASLVRQMTLDAMVSEKVAGQLATLAKTQPALEVARELASVSIRMRATPESNTIVHSLLSNIRDTKDPMLPQLLWVAYEHHVVASSEKELKWLAENAPGNALLTEVIVPRTMRRLMALGTPEAVAKCIAFLGGLDDTNVKRSALRGLTMALENRVIDAPANWKPVYQKLELDKEPEISKLASRLAVNFRDVEVVKKSLAIVVDAKQPIADRLEAIRVLALTRPEEGGAILLRLATTGTNPQLQVEAIRALASFDRPTIAKDLLVGWSKYPANIKNEMIQVLAGRKEWARELMKAVGTKTVARTELTDNTILRMQGFNDGEINRLVEQHWGRVRRTPDELNAIINKMRDQLYEAPASFAKGKIAFTQHCAKCHKFDGAGAEVGPNIEGAGRDIEYLLVNVLDPNRVIGAPYFMRTVTLLNGRNEQGVLHAEDDQSITLKTENAVLKSFPKKEVESIRVQEKSLMPEGLNTAMNVQDFRNLVRYVMANPFITEVTVNGQKPVVGVPGRIPLRIAGPVKVETVVTSPEALKMKLLLGIRTGAKILVNGQAVGSVKGSGVAALPDQVGLTVDLKKGENTIIIEFDSADKADVLYARFLDPDRKLRYPEPVEKK